MINPNIETIKKLHPDYVLLVVPMQNKLKTKLKKAGLKTITCSQSSFNDILDCMYKIGKIADDTTGYLKLKEELRTLDTLSHLNSTVLFILSQKPIYTAGKNTFLDEIIKKAGGINAVKFNDYKMISIEEIIHLNPDIIVIACPGFDIDKFKKSIGVRNIKATKNGCVFRAPTDIFTRPGPRVVKATLLLHKYITRCNRDEKNK